MSEHKEVAKRGANVARDARINMEKEIGEKVVTPLNAKTIKKLK